ncbi:MAG: GspE/PulE family protein [Candidatus Dormibacteria bacterium]
MKAKLIPTKAGGSPRLGDILLEKGLIDAEQLATAVAAQAQSGLPLGEILVSLDFLDEEFLVGTLSEKFVSPIADLARAPIDPEVARLVPEEYARRKMILPMRLVDNRLQVAMRDPNDLTLLKDLRVITGHPLDPQLAGRGELLAAIGRAYSMRGRIDAAAKVFSQARTTEVTAPRGRRSGEIDLAQLTADSPVVEVVNLLITQGLRDRASDIHLEPQENLLRVRFRIDGVLQDVAHLPANIGPGLSSRIKIMSDLDIVERNRAQDGQVSLTVEGKELDVRVATMATIWGEKLVLRLLDRSRSLISLEKLGFSTRTEEGFARMLASPYGMVVVAGPTGSGKTTTLYASLQELDNQQRNIVTIEDPVEYHFEGINQTQINKLANMTFANGLRAVLRQDPDIILVGEIRDRDTAEIAVQAALTGHLVLSSLHATDAASSLLRFLDMGIEGYLVASSVIGVVAQRLVRQVCEGCKTEYPPTVEEVEFGKSMGMDVPDRFYHGHGCSKCSLTGYYDRIGVYEMLPVSEGIKSLILARAGQQQILEAAVAEGMVPLRHDAWRKAVEGSTTVAEALRSVYVL